MTAISKVKAKGSDLEYQGRKTSRTKSETRRKQILEAALNIIISEGVRGIRHRAVAKEANVPLAATTYYFKDIDELIVDAFTLYTEKALKVINAFTEQFYAPMSELAKLDLTSAAGINQLIEFLTQQIMAYSLDQVTNQRDLLIVEQAFRYEAIINDKVRALAQLHRQALIDKAIEFFTKVVHSEYPKADAEILIGLFHSIEYRNLLYGSSETDPDFIRTTIHHYLKIILNTLFKQ